MNGNAAKCFLLFLAFFAWHGCDVGHEKANAGLAGESRAYSEVAATVERMGDVMHMSGNRAWEWGRAVARNVKSVLEKEERKKLCNLYMRKLAALEPLSGDVRKWPVALQNHADVLASLDVLVESEEEVEAFLEEVLRIKEMFLRAMKKCSDELSVQELASKEKAKLRQVTGDLETGLSAFQSMIERVYLPLVAKRRLSPERHRHWAERLGAALDDVRDAAILWQATNLWPSASQMDFLRETFKGYAPLLRRGSPAARDELERWYLNVLDLPRRPDGCDERLERTLHERQIDLLASFARYYVDFRHSNCWLYAARELGRIRSARDPAFADRRAWNEAWGRRMLNAGAVGEARKMRLREWNRQVSLEKMDCQLTEAVISEFCLKGLAKAPSEFQEPLYTDIVSSARLTPNECAKIREALRIGESSSTANVPGRR